MNFYHCSYIHHKVGDILLPHIDGRTYSGGRGIYCTTSPVPHKTLYCNVDKRNDLTFAKLRLYKVLPLKGWYRGDWADIVCPNGVEIVESLGQAPRNKKVSRVTKDLHTKISELDGKNKNKPCFLLTNCGDDDYDWAKWRIKQNKNKYFSKGFRKKEYLEKFLMKKKDVLLKKYGVFFYVYNRQRNTVEEINLIKLN